MKIKLNISKKIFNEVYYPHLYSDKQFQLFYGGSSSGKSFFIAQATILNVLKGHNYLITRKYKSSIKKSIFNEIIKAISFFQLSKYFLINSTDMTITCITNDCQILFSGLDDPEKVKSITPKNGVITRILIEEATEIEEADFKQLTKRLRGTSRLKKSIILTFNPVLKTHWVFREFFDGWDDSKNYMENDKISILKTTYKDNRFLTQEDRDLLENEADIYWYNVYTLGNWGVLGKLIFKNWTTTEMDQETIDSFFNIKNGLDFGFVHPTALVRIHYDKKYKKLYIFDEFCQGDITNDKIAKEVKDRIGREYVTCDSAEPRTIKELRSNDINCLESKKGRDSVLHGIQWLQQHEIIINTKCVNVIREFNTYQWKQNKEGVTLQEPVNINDDCIAAIRYALEAEMLMGLKGKIKLPHG